MESLLKKKLNGYSDYFQHLRRGVTKFGPAPHKLILLLAVLDEAEAGFLTQNRVEISDRLIDGKQYFMQIRKM